MRSTLWGAFLLGVFMVDGGEIAACARGWLGTRFQHQGRLKKTVAHLGGVDCLGLLVGVAAEMGLADKHGRAVVLADEVDYSHMPDIEHMHAVLGGIMERLPPEMVAVGDVALFAIDGRAQHVGIIGWLEGQPSIIHAYAPARAVVEHALDLWWRDRMVAVFRV